MDDRKLSAPPAPKPASYARGGSGAINYWEAGVVPPQIQDTPSAATPESDAGLIELPTAVPTPSGASGQTATMPGVDAGHDPADLEQRDAAPRPPQRCPDLDEDGKLDCDQTLLTNPGFDADDRGWLIEDGTIGAWQHDDAYEKSDSGSLQVTNTLYAPDSSSKGFAGLYQCFSVDAGQEFLAAANVKADDHPESGTGGINVLFFDGPGCVGTPLGTVSAQTTATNGWRVVKTTLTAPEQARSVKVRIGVLKSFNVESFSVFIDNALFRAQ
jgi:hypothetical protein